MSEIEGRAHNIFEDILHEKYDAIVQEAEAVLEKAKGIDQLFFPIDPGLNAWYRRSEAFDPEILRAIENLKSNFGIYRRRLASNVKHLQEAAERKNEKDVVHSFVKMIKHACVKCHARYAGREIPVLKEYLAIEPPKEEKKEEK